jgi:hypothetical protein
MKNTTCAILLLTACGGSDVDIHVDFPDDGFNPDVLDDAGANDGGAVTPDSGQIPVDVDAGGTIDAGVELQDDAGATDAGRHVLELGGTYTVTVTVTSATDSLCTPLHAMPDSERWNVELDDDDDGLRRVTITRGVNELEYTGTSDIDGWLVTRSTSDARYESIVATESGFAGNVKIPGRTATVQSACTLNGVVNGVRE